MIGTVKKEKDSEGTQKKKIKSGKNLNDLQTFLKTMKKDYKKEDELAENLTTKLNIKEKEKEVSLDKDTAESNDKISNNKSVGKKDKDTEELNEEENTETLKLEEVIDVTGVEESKISVEDSILTTFKGIEVTEEDKGNEITGEESGLNAQKDVKEENKKVKKVTGVSQKEVVEHGEDGFLVEALKKDEYTKKAASKHRGKGVFDKYAVIETGSDGKKTVTETSSEKEKVTPRINKEKKDTPKKKKKKPQLDEKGLPIIEEDNKKNNRKPKKRSFGGYTVRGSI